MVIDPRTLRPIKRADRCHLIPECFGVSNKTIRLDGPLDNAVGRHCDSQLHTFFQCLVGDELNVNFSFENGSRSVAGRINPKTKKVWIPKPTGGTPTEWMSRALGLRGNQVRVRKCVTRPVNLRGARMSMVNSAILVLHYLRRPEVYGPGFDTARKLLGMVVRGTLDQADLAEVEEMTPVIGQVNVERAKLRGVTDIGVSELRDYYDPEWDPGDKLLDDFPTNCVSEKGSDLVVRLPYGKALRGVVKFPLLPTA